MNFEKNEIGQSMEIVGTAKEIKMQKQLKNDLKEENVELQRYIAVTKDLFCIFSLNGKIIKINRTWRDSFGYKDEQLVGKSIFEIIVKEDLYATKFAISESV